LRLSTPLQEQRWRTHVDVPGREIIINHMHSLNMDPNSHALHIAEAALLYQRHICPDITQALRGYSLHQISKAVEESHHLASADKTPTAHSNFGPSHQQHQGGPGFSNEGKKNTSIGKSYNRVKDITFDARRLRQQHLLPALEDGALIENGGGERVCWDLRMAPKDPSKHLSPMNSNVWHLKDHLCRWLLRSQLNESDAFVFAFDALSSLLPDDIAESPHFC